MKAKIVTCLAVVAVSAAPVLPGRAIVHAQDQARYPYVLVDLGTLGGPQAFLDLPGPAVTDRGIGLGSADTAIADMHYPIYKPSMSNFADPFIIHAFEWRRGHLRDMGALPGNNSSAILSINARGDGVGFSGNGAMNPVAKWPADTAVLWRDGRVVDLGTLPGGLESFGLTINNRGQVEGFAYNSIPDPYSMTGSGTQVRTFMWQDGVMRDLGTLGGPDSLGWYMNARGQVAGQSYTNATPNAVTGIPTQDPFLWQDGHMLDLGTLGGTSGFANGLNNRGQVAGQSNLAGDQFFHAFLWDRGSLKDLGTLGGNYAAANALNEAGTVVGGATLSNDRPLHAFLWKNGVMTDLGTVAARSDPCLAAWGINLAEQVIGGGGLCGSAQEHYGVLWQHGFAADLNTLVAPSALHVTEAAVINNRGEISAVATLPNGNMRAVLLIPSEEADGEGLMSNAPAIGAVAPAASITAPTDPQRTSPALCAGAVPWRTRFIHAITSPCLGN